MKISNPLITVAMPIYNAGENLRPAVISIITQSYTNWELIIIDDGSTDKSLQSIVDLIDERFIVKRGAKNKGLAVRLNEIIGMAKGKFIARMDQDDISYPDRFLVQLSCFKKEKNLCLVGGRVICISEKNKPTNYLPFSTDHKKIVSKPWRGFYIAHPTWMGKKTWFRKHLYATPGPYLCEDQELLLRSHKSSNFSSSHKIVLAYRIRDQINLSKSIKTRWAFFKVKIKYFLCNREFYNIGCSLLDFITKITMDCCGFKRTMKNVAANHRKEFEDILHRILKFKKN